MRALHMTLKSYCYDLSKEELKIIGSMVVSMLTVLDPRFSRDAIKVMCDAGTNLNYISDFLGFILKIQNHYETKS